MHVLHGALGVILKVMNHGTLHQKLGMLLKKCPTTDERIKNMWCIYTME